MTAITAPAVHAGFITLGAGCKHSRYAPRPPSAKEPAATTAALHSSSSCSNGCSCGSLVDIDCAVGSAPCLTPKEDFGFQIDEAEVAYWGICPACQMTQSQALRTEHAPA